MLELNRAVDLFLAEKKTSSKYKYIACGLICFVVILLAANFGLTYGVVELAKVRSHSVIFLLFVRRKSVKCLCVREYPEITNAPTHWCLFICLSQMPIFFRNMSHIYILILILTKQLFRNLCRIMKSSQMGLC